MLFPSAMEAAEDSTTQAEPTAMEVDASTDSVSAPADPLSAPVDPISAPADPVSTLADPLSAPVDPGSASVDLVSVPTDPVSTLADPLPAPVDPVCAPADVVPDSVVPSLNQSELVSAGTVEPDPVQVHPGPPQDTLEKDATSSKLGLPSLSFNVACNGELLPPEDSTAGKGSSVTASWSIWCIVFGPCSKAITVTVLSNGVVHGGEMQFLLLPYIVK